MLIILSSSSTHHHLLRFLLFITGDWQRESIPTSRCIEKELLLPLMRLKFIDAKNSAPRLALRVFNSIWPKTIMLQPFAPALEN